MKIILDGMGGDNAPEAIVEGAVLASKEIQHQIAIIGKEDLIKDELKKYKELLDGGVITREEFDAKKKQLLNL